MDPRFAQYYPAAPPKRGPGRPKKSEQRPPQYPQQYAPPPQYPQQYAPPPQQYAPPPQHPKPTEDDMFAGLGFTPEEIRLLKSGEFEEDRTAEYRMYASAVFLVACVVFAFVWTKNTIWAPEDGGDDGDLGDYVPPDLDEEDLLGSSEGSGGVLGHVAMFFTSVITIAAGIYTMYMFTKKSLELPSPWVALFVVVYALVMFVVLEWERSRTFVGGMRGTLERVLISVVFGVTAMVFAVVAMRILAKNVVEGRALLMYVVPAFAVVVGMIMGHIIFTNRYAAIVLEKYVLVNTRVYLVPAFVICVFAAPMVSDKFRQSAALVPWIITAGAVAMVFYLMGLVHTRFGKYRAVADLGIKDSSDPCAGCDIFHEFMRDKESRVHTYAEAVCDPNVTAVEKTKLRTKVLANFDVVARTSPKECNSFCAQAKESIKRIKCKCEKGDPDVCGSVADMLLYSEYDKYVKSTGLLDEDWNITASAYEIIVVMGMGFALMTALTWTETIANLKTQYFSMPPSGDGQSATPAAPAANQAAPAAPATPAANQ